MNKMAIEIRIAKLKERGTTNQNIIRKLERQLRKIERGERRSKDIAVPHFFKKIMKPSPF